MASYRLLLAFAATQAFAAPLSAHSPRAEGISWGECSEFWWDPRIQCGNLTVPIDWEAKDGDTFSLQMVRLPRDSNSTKPRVGSLFVNPGGPGASAIQVVTGIATDFYTVSPDLLKSFDIIGIDPRGVRKSVETDCDASIWNERVSLFPKTQQEYDKLVDKNKRLYESCVAKTGDIINYSDTLSTVKDLEAVRAALGEKLNWLGLSYGSQIGSQYASLYPDNIRAMVFDGVLQHSQAESSNVLIEAAAYDAALRSFFEWASTNETSPLHGQDVEKMWYKILDDATKSPIPAPSCGVSCREDVTEDEFRLNAQGHLINRSDYFRMSFAESLLKASNGDASGFSTGFMGGFNKAAYAGITIGCQDWAPRVSSFEELQAKMRIGEVFTPLSKGASQTWTMQTMCIGWPAPLANPPKKLKIETQSPILLVNSLHDPSTSYVWAVGMMEEAENAVLLTRDGDGHTSWGLPGATTEAIDRFLVTAELPAPGTVLDS